MWLHRANTSSPKPAMRQPCLSTNFVATAVASLGARQAYLDGELCGVRADGVTSFNMVIGDCHRDRVGIMACSDAGWTSETLAAVTA
jgi:hypothetical protein